ncbi:MAG: hypothetical protein JW811_07300 [Clostridiales bacterium]|nr:hypothetical protein [Clostridiales bacterium]
MDNRRAIGKAVLLASCWILSFAAMSVTLGDTELFSFWMRVFVPVMLIFGYLFLWKIERVFLRWQLWIAAAVFAAVVTVGAGYDYAGTAEHVINQIWKALVYFLGRVPAFYMGMALVLEVMKKGRPLHKRYPAWAYALAVFICWLPYLVTVWPGSVSDDAAVRLLELCGAKALSGGPTLLQTGFIGLAAVIGRGLFQSADSAVALYCIVQGLLTAWLFGILVSMIAKDGAPLWLTLASLLFFALCPVFPLYAFAVSADTSFALAALWLMLTVWRLLRNETPAHKDVVSLSVSAVLCVLLRGWGVWVTAVPLSVLLVVSLIKRSRIWRGAMYALACAACALIILQGALLPMLRTMNDAETETAAADGATAFNYGYLMPGYISDAEPAFVLGAVGETAGEAFGYTVNPNAGSMNAVFDRLLSYAPFRILAAPGLYGWVALFALAAALARRRWQELSYLLVPLAALAGCLASSVNGSLGLALPVCFAAPAFLAAAAKATRQTETNAL